MKEWYVVVFLWCGIGSVFAGRIDYLNCEGISNKANDVTVDVSDCPSGNNCSLVKGTTHYLTTTFTLEENINNLQIRTLGVMGRLKMPYMGSKQICSEVTTEDGENCDQEVGFLADKRYSHVREFPVRSVYPEITMKARIEYFTGSRPSLKNTIICFEIPIKITKAGENGV